MQEILLPRPFRLHPAFSRRHRRLSWLFFVAAASSISFAILEIVLVQLEPGKRIMALGCSLVSATVLLTLACRSRRYVQVAKALAVDGQETLCRVLEVRARKDPFEFTLWQDFTIEMMPSQRRLKRTLPWKAKLFYLRSNTVLALLVDRLPGHPLLLHHDLWPLQLTGQDWQQTALRLQMLDPGSDWRLVQTDKGPRIRKAPELEQRERSMRRRVEDA